MMWVAVVLLSVAVVVAMCGWLLNRKWKNYWKGHCEQALAENAELDETITKKAVRIVELKNERTELSLRLDELSEPESRIVLLKKNLADKINEIRCVQETASEQSMLYCNALNEKYHLNEILKQYFPEAFTFVWSKVDEQKKAALESLEAIRAAGDSESTRDPQKDTEKGQDESVKGNPTGTFGQDRNPTLQSSQDESVKGNPTGTFEQDRNPTLQNEQDQSGRTVNFNPVDDFEAERAT